MGYRVNLASNGVENQNSDSYKRAVHSTKSNAQTFGTTTLTSETCAMELSATMAADDVSVLSNTFDATVRSLSGLLDE